MAAAARVIETIRRVLVVEDEHAICELFAEILHDAGLGVECVNSDVAAYRALQRPGRYAAVILDVNLGPGTTGFDVARFARQIVPDIAVLYVSGQATEASFKAFGVPNSAFMSKPFEADDLLVTMDVLLEGSGPRG